MTSEGGRWENEHHDGGREQPSPMREVQATDDLHLGAEETIAIRVFQSGALVRYTRELAALAGQVPDQRQEACFATAAMLTAAAALEALLSEFVHETNYNLYTQRNFRREGVPGKYRLVTGNDLVAVHPDIQELWDCRNAIVHSEPDNSRSTHYGIRINVAGAVWAANAVEQFARILWGSGMPEWLRNDSGI